jgi:hypothetical protein
MNKTIKIIFLSLVAIMLLAAPAMGIITEDELFKIAEKHSKTSEKTDVYGPYTTQNKSYYYAEYRTGNVLTGVLVIDVSNGNVVADEKTLRQVLFAVYYLMNTNNDSIAFSNESAQQYKAAAQHYANNQSIANIFNKMAETYEEIETIEKRVVLNVSMSYENAMRLSQLHNGLEASLKSLNAVYNDDMADVAGLTKEDIEDMIEEMETHLQNSKAREDIGVNYASERVETKKTPGFGLIAAVFSLSVIGFFIPRQKK